MPSFKLTIAMLALALSPLASALSIPARPPSAANDLTRRDFRLARPASGINSANRNKRMEAAALRNASAEKRKLKRAALKAAGNKGSLWERVEGATSQNEGSSLEKRQSRRCGTDAACQSSWPAIANGVAKCVNGGCVYQCNQNYINSTPSGGLGSVCNRQPARCATRCPAVMDGYSVCNANNQCQATCQASAGLTFFNINGPRCVNLNNDPSHCGNFRRVCRTSYNGVGTPICQAGTCSLDCPAGLNPVPVNSGAHPFACA